VCAHLADGPETAYSPLREHSDTERIREKAREQWQRRLLPTMIATLIGASIAFLALSLYDTYTVRQRIATPPTLDLTSTLASVNCAQASNVPAERRLCLEWKVAVLLEQQTINRRYHQANVALLVRISVKYLGFLVGMLMSLVGAVFVLGRLTEASSEVAAEGPFGKFTIATVSPGLILAFLGTVLMIATLYVNPPTDVTDGNVYLRSPVTGTPP
jgi:hypothetical protein